MTAPRGRFLHVEAIPSASYSMTLRVEFPNRGGTLGAILTAVGEAGGMAGAADIVGMRAAGGGGGPRRWRAVGPGPGGWRGGGGDGRSGRHSSDAGGAKRPRHHR